MLIAFITGLTASLHCIGMCGPLSLALPVGGLSVNQLWLARLSYHLARCLSYSLLGMAVGLLGERFSLFGWQQQISVLAGLLMIAFLVGNRWLAFRPILRLQKLFGKVLILKTWWSYPAAGFLNGWLPCGLVYVALAGALTANSPLEGMLFMTVYGLGTLPALLAVSWVWRWISLPLRQRLNRWLPVVTLAIALLFIWRGLGLNLPYSPEVSISASQPAPVCHE
ncbi:hypothetical protein BWI96_17240 [Siphonobacter sp. SORGH_AS_0500]|uniref:sulfite exporter TauE/SafE family protein n=1 Tax=Siphonobacter sp. SORGH_AS_0500 TaxID=1864824 RepID=UPI000CA959D9|nr:sulfite exporter TauE/SafE family protein [Siphonobacter sp. SORGH_AS_0500]PKK35451.1 hypothetical protein BWI96_17240 [Siphonobacter sp. SORGH_AS_0500]